MCFKLAGTQTVAECGRVCWQFYLSRPKRYLFSLSIYLFITTRTRDKKGVPHRKAREPFGLFVFVNQERKFSLITEHKEDMWGGYRVAGCNTYIIEKNFPQKREKLSSFHTMCFTRARAGCYLLR